MNDWLQEHIPVLVGLVVGTLAHFGRIIKDGGTLTIAHVVGHIFQLGFIGVFAAVTINLLGITGETNQIMVASVFAVSAQEVIQWVKRDGWRRLVNASREEGKP